MAAQSEARLGAGQEQEEPTRIVTQQQGGPASAVTRRVESEQAVRGRGQSSTVPWLFYSNST